MPAFSLHFAAQGGLQTGVYRLIELPQELITVVERATDQSLTIRGDTDEDAVLCTGDRTFAIRAVTISNSYCIVRPSQEKEEGDAVIRDTVQQILEPSASVAKLHKLNGLLRGREYDGMTEDEELRHKNNGLHKLEDIKATIQASDKEFEEGLRERHILTLNGELRPITLSYLSSVLELILNTMVASSLSPESAPVANVAETLERDHEIPRSITLQVMFWFGTIAGLSPGEGIWSADIEDIVRQLGIGLLNAYRNTTIPEEIFMKEWRKAVGDAYESRAQLPLLSGNYICRSSSEGRMLAYFPSFELPVVPADRFSDLFLTQSRWTTDEIAPFLRDIAIDNKERDRLLMKYARTTTDSEGQIWYTSRSGTL